MADKVRPTLLSDVRVIESSMLGPGALGVHLADLGADVIKVEPPQGDYIRQMTWPIIEGNSLLHLHVHRGKRSIVLDLRNEAGVNAYLDLVRHSDAVIEAMRPGGLAKRGLSFERMCEVNPRIVFCTISGFGMTGPYRDLPSHGIAYDTWAGLIKPEITEEGFTAIPEHPSVGIHAGPLYGALGILAAIIRARSTGQPAFLEIAQSDAAASMDWLRSETWKSYERPQSEVTGNATDNYERRPPGTAGMRDSVRYQIYESSDGHVMLQASEQAFWKNFCVAIGRTDLFDRWPGEKYADHALGNLELRAELTRIFKTRTTAQWMELGGEANTPIMVVNTPQTIANDPQFQDRLPWLPRAALGAEQLPIPVKVVGEQTPVPTRAPDLGQHTTEVLRDVLGYDDGQIAAAAGTK